ncbi:MAG: S8 family serine peptidase [Anaerolineae bacterium]|nr:S8 family serine peptidase [Anaerolineae bacterium]
MPKRNLIYLLLLSILLAIFAVTIASQPTVAQEPDGPPIKGYEPLPNNPTSALTSSATASIDPGLLLKIDPQLLKQILTSPDRTAPFIVHMQVQADPAAAVAQAKSRSGSQKELTELEKRKAVVDTLQQTARNTQGGVLQVLNVSKTRSLPTTKVKPLWIVNAVAANGSLETILELAARPDVKMVRLDKTTKIDNPVGEENFATAMDDNAQSPLATTSEWGVQKIRADVVHSALNIDGTGVTVANIDTGVDGYHPALLANYRGYKGSGKLPIHLGNWYDSTGEGTAYPVDTNGHGTHTMGTIAGGNGVGVSPGAQWIAVRAFDSSGGALDSWIHDAFQWIIAPNGDPTLAPDVVNNSWSNDNGLVTEFQADIQALNTAGIFLVFSAGNNGPDSETVGSPASLDGAFAVGATDINDEVALFSSRGPSPWGKTKPEVSAPGKDILSTLPGGVYGTFSGTSMSAPHVSGLVALLLQAKPSLGSNLNSIATTLKSTSVPLGNNPPNNNYGWGRVDAYNAVMAVASIGTLKGTVSNGSQPIANASVTITSHSEGAVTNITTASDGTYSIGLAAGTYNVKASAFGYEPVTQFGVTIIDGAVKTNNFTLTAKPTGRLVGTVKDKFNPSIVLAATVLVDGTPVSVNTNPATGAYSLNLPVGVYTVTVIEPEHRIGKAYNITINDGATVTKDFLLARAPSILLVDSGRWYQASQIAYFKQALRDALYPSDLWQITDPNDKTGDVPTAADLANYDIVIWSSPADSPGYVGADDALVEYLDNGGRLLISGQDVAYYDGGGFLDSAGYFSNYLHASFVQDNSGIDTISGVSNAPFAGVSFSIAGNGGANNQISPDVIAYTDSDFAGSLLTYDDENNDQVAGLYVGLCLPYRAILLSFGLEGITNKTTRSQVMAEAIGWLMQSQPVYDFEVSPAQETRVGNFGTTITQSLQLRNTGASADTYNFSVSNGLPYNWALTNKPTPVSIDSCTSKEIVVNVSVPAAKRWHISDTFTVATQSIGSGTSKTITRTTKTPAPVLLVDDDRWYSFADTYKAVLEAHQIDYDYWLVPKSWLGSAPPSPSLQTLQMYPITVWYTAYDWYQPLTPTEEDRLSNYLKRGGRLFFSSQDFLYQHLQMHNGTYAPFAQDYLGIQSHTEDFTSTVTIGQPGNPIGSNLGPYALNFPPGYQNWTDGLEPTTSAQVVTRGQDGQINSLSNTGIASGGNVWRTHFLSYGPELLAPAEQDRLMQRSLGWLSWLGSSTVTSSADASLDGERITYTATVKNDGWYAMTTAYFTATFPSLLVPETASPELTLVNSNFVWNGPLAKDEQKVLTYTAIISDDLPLGTLISQTNWFGYSDHNIVFDNVADVRVNFPTYDSSSFTVSPGNNVGAGDILNYTVTLKNDGVIDSPMVTLTNTLPHMLDITALVPPSQGNFERTGRVFTWTLPLAKNETATLNYQAVISYQTSSPVENKVTLNDNLNPPLTLTAKTTYKVLPLYFPILHKN